MVTALLRIATQLLIIVPHIGRILKSSFYFCVEGSGTIDVAELRAAMEALGQHPSDEELLAMIALVDDDNSGQIEFAEFLKVVESHRVGPGRAEDDADTVAAFVAMGGNPDKTGFVEVGMGLHGTGIEAVKCYVWCHQRSLTVPAQQDMNCRDCLSTCRRRS